MIPRHILIGILAIPAYLLGASPADAAVPSNDTIAGATAITTLPFSDTIDTTAAHTDADELAAAQPCIALGAPAVEKAVWYRYTASANITLLVDTTASSYGTGIAAYHGTPSPSTFGGCAPGRLTTSVAGGETAFLMIFGDMPGSPGGTLRITVQEAPPVPQVSLSVDTTGTFDPRSGSASVNGTFTCTGVADFSGIQGQLTQTVGRFSVSGFFFTSAPCDGVAHTLTAQVTPQNGKFAGGPATVQAFGFACNASGCGQAEVTRQVRLSR